MSHQESATPNAGTLLQRGGEELVIEKVDDRFTVKPVSPEVLPQVTQTIDMPDLQVAKTIAPAQSTEVIVDPSQRDQAMQAVRSLEEVEYASHVYQFKDAPGTLIYLTDQVTIQFAPQISPEMIAAIAQEYSLEQLKPVVGIPNTFVFKVTTNTGENPVKLANRLIRRPEILTAEPNIVVNTQPHYRPQDGLYPRQWHLNHNGGPDLAPGAHLAVEQAWDITRGDRSIVVAVLDDSFDLNHPDFQGPGKIVAPRDFRDQDFLPLPSDREASHGTACAGIAIAEENGSGVVGVAPGCAFMPIRSTGFLDDETVEQMFGWAVQQGAAVISCSWGPSAVYFPLSLRQRSAITRAATSARNGKGCVIVFAAGNANRPVLGKIDERNWPKNALQGPTDWLAGFAAHPDVIAVSACTSLNKKAAYSNWGQQISVCAPSNNAPPGLWLPTTGFVATPPSITATLPGKAVVTTDQLQSAGYSGGDYTETFGGTSSACPMVAGVAALMLSVNPDLTAHQVRDLLQQTADKIVDPDPDPQFGFRLGTYENDNHSDWFGYGKVNAFRAVQAAQNQQGVVLQVSRQIQARNQSSLPIPDADRKGIISKIEITEPSLIAEITVTVAITHTFLGDLEIRLMAPTGEAILLQGRTLGRRTQLQGTYSLQNTPLLKRLLNRPAKGIWQLQVADLAPTNTGTLQGWGLTLGV